MWFELIILLSFILNIFTIIKFFKNILNIEDKTYNQLQNYLNTSKPDKLFKTYYDYFENYYTTQAPITNSTSANSKFTKIDNQVITIEFNENYKNYHAGKACMSDIINNLNYSYKDLMNIDEQPKLIFNESDNTWYLNVSKSNRNIDLSKEIFKNTAINFHINYIDLNQIAKTVRREDLDKLSDIFKKLVTMTSSQYIIYDIYENKFDHYSISEKVKTWNDYINECLNMHYKLINENDNEKSKNKKVKTEKTNEKASQSEIINTFAKISRKYNWMFKNGNTLYLYNPNVNKMALPNPDGLIVNQQKMI